MTTHSPRPKLPVHFPLGVAAGTLVFYLLFVRPGVTFEGLPLTAQFAGWNEQPLTGQPLLWLLTLPLHLLPAAWMTGGLSCFSALTAAVLLAAGSGVGAASGGHPAGRVGRGRVRVGT